MFSLKLDGKECIACAICMDVCHAGAIAMRLNKSKPVEGDVLTFLLLQSPRNLEAAPQPKATFPYLVRPAACDGCADCVEECPVGALRLAGVESEPIEGESFMPPAVHRFPYLC